MPTESAELPIWYRSVLALLDRLRYCIQALDCQLHALPPDHYDRRNTACQAMKVACETFSQAQDLCASATEHLRQGTTPGTKWFESLHIMTMRTEQLVAETKAAIRPAVSEPPVAISDAERKRYAAFLWRFTSEVLATKVFRRLSSGILEPARDEPLVGMLERCETSANKVGDVEYRMAISPTPKTARMAVVNIARQLIEEGCSEAESKEMIAVAERERDRIRGGDVDAEVECAAVEPTILQG